MANFLAQFQSIKTTCDHVVIAVEDVSDLWPLVKKGFEDHLPFKRAFLNNKTRNPVLVDELPAEYILTTDSRLRSRFPQEQSLFWFREPYATVVLVSCEDLDEFKTILKPRLKLIVQNDEREWFIVFVSKAASHNDQSTKMAKKVYAKLEVEFSSKKRERCCKLDIHGPDTNFWDDLEAKIMECIRNTLDRRIQFYEEEIRKLSEQRFMPVWNFCNFFILKESLAFMFEIAHLHEDALREYDELELCYLETVNMSGKQRDFGGMDSGDDQAALLNPGAKALNQIVQDDSFREFDFRQYLFACQSKLLFKLTRPFEVASRGHSFIISFSKALALHESKLPFCTREVWVITASLALINATASQYKDGQVAPDIEKEFYRVQGDLYSLCRTKFMRLAYLIGYGLHIERSPVNSASLSMLPWPKPGVWPSLPPDASSEVLVKEKMMFEESLRVKHFGIQRKPLPLEPSVLLREANRRRASISAGNVFEMFDGHPNAIDGSGSFSSPAKAQSITMSRTNSSPGNFESSIGRPLRLSEICVAAEHALRNTISDAELRKSLSSVEEFEGRQIAAFMSQSSPISSTFSLSPSLYSTQHPGFTVVGSESYQRYQDESRRGCAEICPDAVIQGNGMNVSDITRRTEGVNSLPKLEISQALQRLEEQLNLNDDSSPEIYPLYSEIENSNDAENLVHDKSSTVQIQDNSNNLLLLPHSGESSESQDQLLNLDADMWKEMLDHFRSSPAAQSQAKCFEKLDENGMLQTSSGSELIEATKSDRWPKISGKEALKSSVTSLKQVDDFKYLACAQINTFGSYLDQCTAIFDQDQIGISFEANMSLNFVQKQKFTIHDISPDWGYASNATKVVIVGSYLCNPSEYTWTCMFGDIEVPVQIINEGAIRCQAPPHLPGKVALCVTTGNRVPCSEVKEFEFRAKLDDRGQNILPEVGGASKGSEELLLLVRFVQMLLSDSSLQRGDSSGSSNDILEKSKASEDSWSQVIDSLLFGTSTSTITIDWLLQELLKNKLQQWLSSKLQVKNNEMSYSLSRKEQGIIHMIAGLGFEWALQPILNAGVNANFRDISGWTALHWAARFGREKMVASLIASGAFAGAVTDPSSQDPFGKTAASIASSCGHKGVAGYLSEVALTSHLTSLTLEENEVSKGTADIEAEKTISSITATSPVTHEDQLSLKETLDAVRNAAQAAARIQSAFRAHSFRKRRLREATCAATTCGDEYCALSNDVLGLSAASKFAFRNTRDHNSAALSIQKKYRGWKGRKDFLAFRQKVVKIQAHVRGYQVRKEYKVCWAVGILEKVVLRWLRRGVGLRGFRLEDEPIKESEAEDILKLFRKQKVDAAVNEAVSRVLSMVDSPEARQQYHRILGRYRQAKSELAGAKSDSIHCT